MVYNGNMDLICNLMGTDGYLRTFQWPGRADFLASNRTVWKYIDNKDADGGKLSTAGWFRSGGNLTQLVVANAGHMAPADQPEAVFDMLQKFLAADF